MELAVNRLRQYVLVYDIYRVSRAREKFAMDLGVRVWFSTGNTVFPPLTTC